MRDVPSRVIVMKENNCVWIWVCEHVCMRFPDVELKFWFFFFLCTHHISTIAPHDTEFSQFKVQIPWHFWRACQDLLVILSRSLRFVWAEVGKYHLLGKYSTAVCCTLSWLWPWSDCGVHGVSGVWALLVLQSVWLKKKSPFLFSLIILSGDYYIVLKLVWS